MFERGGEREKKKGAAQPFEQNFPVQRGGDVWGDKKGGKKSKGPNSKEEAGVPSFY